MLSSPYQRCEAAMLNTGRQVEMANILVVDDCRDTAESMAMWLKQLGHEVHIARDGIEAIEMAHREQPQYVLLDLGLPRLDGYQVAARLRKELPGPLVIIAITGYGQEKDRRRALAAGCDHHFLKPVDSNALLALLSELTAVPFSSIQAEPPPATVNHPSPVVRREAEIINTLGLHLRAAAKFVHLSKGFQASVTVIHDGREVSGKSIIELATLAAECGYRVVLNAEGPDAEAAVDALTALIMRRFDEEQAAPVSYDAGIAS
jgi:phosphotransferase system HPr (HPr) family protein